jgi:AraC-like DNA-binding protein
MRSEEGMGLSTRPAAIVATDDLAMDPALLSNRQRFSTGDYQVARRYIERTTQGLFDFSLQRAREFRQYDVRSARLGETQFALVKVDSLSGYHIEMKDNPDLVLLHIVMRGTAQLQQGAVHAVAGPSQMALLEATGRSYKRWHGSTQLLMVKLSRSRMERALASETGIDVGKPLDFGVLQVVDLQQVATLWHSIVTICRDLNDPHPCLGGPAGRLAERMLFLLLAAAVPNNYSRALADRTPSSPAAPYYVRRVEDYIRNHAREPISPADLVSIGGASARSLYHGFRRFRSTTPMGYLKEVRLGFARDALMKGRANGVVSVTEAAMAAGYTNLSQFSRDYKARFGEPPSRTKGCI